MSEKIAHFGARARVVDLLGREQIADAATALGELLKNSVDALASEASVRFDTEHNCLQVEDDGLGMRTEDLLGKWLVLATESKHKTPDAEKNNSEYRRFADPKRVATADKYAPLGEKGIGRLAVAALGRGVLVWTRWGEDSEIQRTLLFIHWSLFEHPRLSLNDIIIPYLELHNRTATVDDALTLFAQIENWVLTNNNFWQSEREKEIRDTILNDVREHFFAYLGGDIVFSAEMGTLFCILGTREGVESFFDEPKVNEETSGNEGEGFRLLVGFCDPFGVNEERLKVRLERNGTPANAEQYFWQEEDFAKVDHYIDITMDGAGLVQGKIRRFKEEFDYTYQIKQLPRAHTFPGPVRLRLGYVEGVLQTSEMPPDQWRFFEARLRAFSGIYVYRDGIRVLPYGRRDIDLLQIEQRRLRNAGLYFFSQRRMFGALYISAHDNPKLKDKAGREGFVNNTTHKGLQYAFDDILVDLAYTYFGRRSDRTDKQERRLIKEAHNAEAARNRIKSEMGAFKRDLALWRRRLPTIEAESKKTLETVETYLDAASQSKGQNMENAVADCQRALDVARRVLKRAENELGSEAPPIISLSDSDRETFDAYLSARAQWQNSTSRHLAKLAASVESLTARYRSDNERLLSVQKRITHTSGEYREMLAGAADRFRAAAEEVLAEEVPNWRVFQIYALEKILSDALGENPAAEVVADKSGAKAAELEAVLAQQLRITREVHLPYWEALIQQIEHIDQAEAGEMAIGELNRRLEAALERERIFAELAQLGLIVESLDHDYNVLFHDIRKRLDDLQKVVAKDEKALQVLDRTRRSFNSLSFKLRLLSPLYRQRQTGIGDLTGKTIYQFIDQLYPPEQREDVEFDPTPKFLEQTLVGINTAVVLSATANLVNNSFYWTTQGTGKRQIRFTSTKGGFIISDSGPGVSPRDAERIFEPFFGRRPYGRGLGLYIARTNLEASGMEIFLSDERQPRALPGANFVIRKRFLESDDTSRSDA